MTKTRTPATTKIELNTATECRAEALSCEPSAAFRAPAHLARTPQRALVAPARHGEREVGARAAAPDNSPARRSRSVFSRWQWLQRHFMFDRVVGPPLATGSS